MKAGVRIINYIEQAREIDKFLTDRKITIIKKPDLRAKFNICNGNASPIYSALASLGWIVQAHDLRKAEISK